MVAGAHQSFQFFNTWFHENNRPSSKFLYWILHCFISIAKLLKKQSIRPKVILPTRATLTRNNRSQMFLKILQYVQESTCAGVFLNKVAGFLAWNFIKKRPNTSVFELLNF